MLFFPHSLALVARLCSLSDTQAATTHGNAGLLLRRHYARELEHVPLSLYARTRPGRDKGKGKEPLPAYRESEVAASSSQEVEPTYDPVESEKHLKTKLAESKAKLPESRANLARYKKELAQWEPYLTGLLTGTTTPQYTKLSVAKTQTATQVGTLKAQVAKFSKEVEELESEIKRATTNLEIVRTKKQQ